MIHLKPCPFCGTTDLFLYPDGEEEGHLVMGNHKPDCPLAQFFGYSSEEEAITGWNKRHDIFKQTDPWESVLGHLKDDEYDPRN